MIASLMLFASVVAACLALAALAIESLLHQLGRPVRWVWAGAIALTVLLLVLAPLRRQTAPASNELVPTLSSRLSSLPFTIAPSPASVPHTAINMLVIGWLGASVFLVLIVAGVQLRYRRLRGQWPATTLGGATVRLSPSMGPAVMGLWSPEIVVPQWLLERGAVEQSIVVAHEREHLRARDPLLLESALFVALLMPWNLAIWWMLSRLRLAVELDCDARVIGAGTTPQIYGNLLIDVAALHAGHRVPALALLNPPSNLQRRLIAMRPHAIRFARLRLAAAGIAALGALIVACQAELPTDQSVASLDAAGAERRAMLTADTIVFKVDGKVVDAQTARSLRGLEIASVEVAKSQRQLEKQRAADTISITTLGRDGEPRTNLVLFKQEAKREAALSDSMKVLAAAEGLATKVAYRTNDRVESFHGLLFIDGKRVDVSEFEKLDQTRIKNVEVIKGPSARKLYNDPAAEFGVIKVVTK